MCCKVNIFLQIIVTIKLKSLKQTKYYPNKPKLGWITKISKMSDTEMFLPYKPEERNIKKD